MEKVGQLIALLDTHVSTLRSYCEAAARLLSSEEYEAAAASFEELLVGLRAARTEADRILAPGASGGWRECVALLEEAVREADRQAPMFAKYAGAKVETEFGAAKVAAGVAKGRSLMPGVADQILASGWTQELTVVAAELNRAAGEARQRNWWTALTIVEEAAEKVEGLLADISAEVAAPNPPTPQQGPGQSAAPTSVPAAPARPTGAHPEVAAAQRSVATLRAQGHRVVGTLSSRAEMLVATDVARLEQGLRAVAVTLGQVSDELSRPAPDMARATTELKSVQNTLDSIEAEVSVTRGPRR